MSTRGAFGIRKDGVDKVCYLSSDSDCFGAYLQEVFSEIDFCRLYASARVSEDEDDEPYSLEEFDTNYPEENWNFPEFLKEGTFCKWAYIVNLDLEVVEIYSGSLVTERPVGRYSGITPEYPYPVTHVKYVTFSEVRRDIDSIELAVTQHEAAVEDFHADQGEILDSLKGALETLGLNTAPAHVLRHRSKLTLRNESVLNQWLKGEHPPGYLPLEML